ncbi:MAG: hypothetical protein SAL70_28050 [Scytonema sp. PMC 1070.18]|nr:hypothetical protein [Scytonema sp. PMC 1070.18]
MVYLSELMWRTTRAFLETAKFVQEAQIWTPLNKLPQMLGIWQSISKLQPKSRRKDAEKNT